MSEDTHERGVSLSDWWDGSSRGDDQSPVIDITDRPSQLMGPSLHRASLPNRTTLTQVFALADSGSESALSDDETEKIEEAPSQQTQESRPSEIPSDASWVDWFKSGRKARSSCLACF